MNKTVKLIIVIGLIIALITFGYTAGYQIGLTLGQDIMHQAVENNVLTK